MRQIRLSIGIALMLLGCGRVGFDRLSANQDADPDGNGVDVSGDATIDASGDAIINDTSLDSNDGSINCGTGCSGAIQTWAKGFGNTGKDGAVAIEIDSSNNVYLTGTFVGAVDFGGGSLDAGTAADVVVASFDASGNHRWSQVPSGIGGPPSVPQFVNDLAVYDNEHLAVVGERSSIAPAFFTYSYDVAGADRWSEVFPYSFGTNSFSLSGVTAPNRLHVFLTGSFVTGGAFFWCNSNLPSDGIATDFFLARVNAGTGECQWVNTYGGSQPDLGADVVAKTDGTVFVVGSFGGSFSAGGATLSSAGGSDVFVASFTSDGDHLWSTAVGSAGDDKGYRVTLSMDQQQLLIAGTFEQSINFGTGPLTSTGATDVFVASFNADDGQIQWANRLGGSADDVINNLQASPLGGVHICGDYSGTVDFGDAQRTSQGDTDAYVAAFDLGTGTALASRSFGGTGTDSCRDLAFDSAGANYLTGYFANAVDFDGTVLNSAGNLDMFLIRTEPVWSCNCP